MYSHVEVIYDDDYADDDDSDSPVYQPAADTDLAVDAEPPEAAAAAEALPVGAGPAAGGYVAAPAAPTYPADSTALDRFLLDD